MELARRYLSKALELNPYEPNARMMLSYINSQGTVGR
jgi:hypothetical protein